MPLPPEGRKAIEVVTKFEDKVSDNFIRGMNTTQRAMFRMLVAEVEAMAAGPGGIKMTAKNSARLTNLKARIRRMLLKGNYGGLVSDYLSAFDEMERLVIDKHIKVNQLEAPKKWFKGLNLQSKENLKNALTKSGVENRVIDPIMTEFSNQVTTGANAGDLIDSLRVLALGDKEAETLGLLDRYAGQIGRDTINQYHGAVDEIIGTRFGLNWGTYTGSIITTTRAQCKKWANETYLHRSELEGEIAWAKSNGSGMIPTTNPSNFAINRGGYNCRHSFTWVSDEIVPEERRNEFENQ